MAIRNAYGLESLALLMILMKSSSVGDCNKYSFASIFFLERSTSACHLNFHFIMYDFITTDVSTINCLPLYFAQGVMVW